ncbi:MAG: class II glutamine amidotransferase [Thermoplasmata archaeon]|nr:class II glutamine amidotransferase [Thermoplasmata archaeon]
MCRMIGGVFRDKFPIGALKDLQHVSELGEVPDRGTEELGHRDGWGIVTFSSGSSKLLGKSERPMHLDPSFDAALEDVAKLEGPNILIAHARRGSEGSLSLANTHPFISDGIVFAHNGTVKKFHPNTSSNPLGQTDSERVFMTLLDRLDEKKSMTSAIETLVKEDVRGHEFTGLMLLISDGKKLYGYRGYSQEKDSWYYTMNVSKCPDEVIVYQQTHMGYAPPIDEVKNGELVTVDLDLNVEIIHL